MPSPNPSVPSSSRRRPAPREAAPPRNQVQDADLLESALSGSREAWAEFVARYSRLVYSIPRRYGMDVHASEDVFQEVFSIFLRQVRGIRNRTGLPKWFLTTAHRVCRQSCAAARRRVVLEGPLADAAPPADLAARWERQHVVRRALARLGGRCEELIAALYTHNGPAAYAEIAQRLGMPPGAIGPTRARCLQKLLKLLEDEAECP